MICGGGDTLSDSSNAAPGYATFIGGGHHNVASGDSSVVVGGTSNTASGGQSAIGGGVFNSAEGDYSTVGGGMWDTASGLSSTVGGGGHNVASDLGCTIGGGITNFAGSGQGSTVSGGRNNTATGLDATIAGGRYNRTSNNYAVVGGGYSDTASGYASVVAGGFGNAASGDESTVCGGEDNTASGARSVVAGGYWNTASGLGSAVGGGYRNYVSHDYSCIPGGEKDTVTSGNSMAFGKGVYVNWASTVVFFDGTVSGRLFINRDGHDGLSLDPLRVGTSTSNGNGAYLTNGGTWTNGSSRTFKDNFQPLDGKEVLEKVSNMPVEAWRYKDTDERHIGPVAEDFVAVFDVGTIRENDGTRENQYLAASDVAGVALAGVKELAKDNRELRERIEQLESLVGMLLAQQRGSKSGSDELALGK